MQSGRRDSNPRSSPWQGDAVPLSYSRVTADLLTPRRFSAETQGRTADTAIFSRVLYQLSYLGVKRPVFYNSADRLSSNFLNATAPCSPPHGAVRLAFDILSVAARFGLADP